MFQAERLAASLDNAPRLRELGVHVADCLVDNGEDGALTLRKVPPNRYEVGRMEQFYCVYNVQLSEGPSVEGRGGRSAHWTPRVVCEKGMPVSLRANWTCRQNHTCITQLILRLRIRPSGDVLLHFPVKSDVFSPHAGEQTFCADFEAPRRAGLYEIDFVTAWEYQMDHAVRNVAKLPSLGTLALLSVGEVVPWRRERVVWLGQRSESSPLSLLSGDIVRKVLARCGDWREGCECSVCTKRWAGGCAAADANAVADAEFASVAAAAH